MFKNLILYRVTVLPVNAAAVDAALARQRFAPCGATQPASAGWVEPRGEAHGPLVEVIDGQLILRLQTERKLLPGPVVSARAEERASEIEKTTGRKPGRREIKVIKEEALLELLPQAFVRQAAITVWIDPAARILAIGTGSVARADEVVSVLVKALDGLSVMLLQSAVAPASAMSAWLGTGEAPSGFSIDRDCELKSPDEMKSMVRYGRHGLDTADVRIHIEQGKRPTRLAMTWQDRVSFVLTEGLQVKRLDFLDGVFDGMSTSDMDGFEADVSIATGELRRLIPELLEALGGELDVLKPGAAPAAAAAAPAREMAEA